MHDPKTVAFSIKSPFVARMKDGSRDKLGYRNTLVTIWHVDPETDGNDDSCGWFSKPASEAERAWAEKYAKDEWKSWFCEEWASINLLHASEFVIVCAVWGLVRNYYRCGGKGYPFGNMGMADIRECISITSNPNDNFGHLVRAAKKDEEGFERLVLLTMRLYRRLHRPWWRHPKFHVYHWQIQVHPWQAFCRWAFSRCSVCGKRFPWGYAPIRGSWHGTGPRFGRGEEGVMHHDCAVVRAPAPRKDWPQNYEQPRITKDPEAVAALEAIRKRNGA